MACAGVGRVVVAWLVGLDGLAQAEPVSDDSPRLAALNSAYARGDHALARRLAKGLTASTDAAEASRAAQVLAQTEPDPFIYVVAIVGLGLVAYLVYNYIL